MSTVTIPHIWLKGLTICNAEVQGVGETVVIQKTDKFNPSLVDGWVFSGYSNDNPPAGIKGVKGNVLENKNFAYVANSGFNGCPQNFNKWIFGSTVNLVSSKTDSSAIIKVNEDKNQFGYALGCVKTNYKNVEYKVRISHNRGSAIPMSFISTDGNTISTKIKEYTINSGDIIVVPKVPDDIFNNADEPRIYFAFTATKWDNAEIILEQIPEYEGALVYDGVDDFSVCNNIPILTDYTIIARRVRLLKSSGGRSIFASKSKIVGQGAFIFEFDNLSVNNTTNTYSFAYNNTVTYNSNEITWQTKDSYNGIPINTDITTDTDTLFIGNIRESNLANLFSGAIYWFALYNKSLTVKEIEEETVKLENEWNKRLKE